MLSLFSCWETTKSETPIELVIGREEKKILSEKITSLEREIKSLRNSQPIHKTVMKNEKELADKMEELNLENKKIKKELKMMKTLKLKAEKRGKKVIAKKIENFIKANIPRIDPTNIDDSESERIGEGSFAFVEKSKFKGFDVAVKRMWLERRYSENPLLSKEIQRELFTTYKMSFFPGFAQLFGYCIDDREFAIVSELLEGNVTGLFKTLDNKERFSLIQKIAFSIDCIHKNGFLHRDIKGNNILYKNNLDPVIVDFGLTKIQLDNRFSCDGMKGNIRWKPYEVIDQKLYTFKSDIYSFGMTLLELIFDKIPYHDVKELEIYGMIQKGQLPKETEDLRNVWKVLIQKCCDVECKKRFNAEEVLEYLKTNKEELEKGFLNSV